MGRAQQKEHRLRTVESELCKSPHRSELPHLNEDNVLPGRRYKLAAPHPPALLPS